MSSVVTQLPAEPVKVTTAAVVARDHRAVSSYVLVTDGANDATLKIYKNDEATAANLLWQDTCPAANLAKAFGFPKPIGGMNESDTLRLVVSGTGAEAFVQTSAV